MLEISWAEVISNRSSKIHQTWSTDLCTCVKTPNMISVGFWGFPIMSNELHPSSVGVGVLGGLVYAVGGYDGNSRHCLSSVEVYDPDRDIWHQVRVWRAVEFVGSMRDTDM